MRAPHGAQRATPWLCRAAAGLAGAAGAGGSEEAFTKFGAGYCRAESDTDMSNQHPWTARTECIALEECQHKCLDGDNGVPCAGLAWAEESAEDNSCKQAGKPRCNIYFGEEPVTTTTSGYQEYACYVPPADQSAKASGASHEGTPDGSGSHDCSDGPEDSWSQDKKVYCCTQELLGCSFDCKDGAKDWQASWSPLKKAWCCKQDEKACHEGAPATKQLEEGSSSTKAPEEDTAGAHAKAASTPVPTASAAEPAAAGPTTTAEGGEEGDGEDCDTLCAFEGQSESCRDRIQWVADNVFADAPSKACSKGLKRVQDDCDVCASCTLSEAECVSPAADPAEAEDDAKGEDADASSTTSGGADGIAAATASEDEAEGCDALCDYGGHQRDCRSRIQKAAGQKLEEMSVSCELAHSMVLSHCPSCGRCVLSRAGCVDDGNTSSAAADGGAAAPAASEPASAAEDDATASATASPEQPTTSAAAAPADATTEGPGAAAAAGEEPPTQTEEPVDDDPRWERAPDTGCTNWADISLGDPVQQSSAEGCGQLCLDTAGCVGFGYQPGTCRVGDSGGESLQGGCYLWNGDCSMGVNECWDEYTLTNASTTPSGNSSTASATTEQAGDVAGGGDSSTTPEAGSSKTTTEANSATTLEASTGPGALPGALPPWWITHGVHPAKEKDMGSWTAVTFSEEQQEQFGVDEMGGIVNQTRFDAAIGSQTEAATADGISTTAEGAATPPAKDGGAATAEQKFTLTADGEALGRPRGGGGAPLSAAAPAAALAALAALAAAARGGGRRPAAGALALGGAADEALPAAQRWGYAALVPAAAAPEAAGGLLWPAVGAV